jgi:alkylated DNA nucleotide flippase Atl1
MSISSTRAQAVAEILWELKKAQKLATLTSIAERAGFSPGSGGRSVSTCLKTVRREWPHLQWWRAVADNGQLEREQELHLVEAGFETETVHGDTFAVISLETQCMDWGETEDEPGEDNPPSNED